MIPPPAGQHVTRNDRAVIEAALKAHHSAIKFTHDDVRYCAPADRPILAAEMEQVDRLLGTITHWAPLRPLTNRGTSCQSNGMTTTVIDRIAAELREEFPAGCVLPLDRILDALSDADDFGTITVKVPSHWEFTLSVADAQDLVDAAKAATTVRRFGTIEDRDWSAPIWQVVD